MAIAAIGVIVGFSLLNLKTPPNDVPDNTVSQKTPGAAVEPAVACYWTERGFEPDKLASGWLLCRFVTPGARVVVSEQAHRPERVIDFDVPTSPLSRQPGKSAFHVILEISGISDPHLESIAAVFDELELQRWKTQRGPLATRVQMGLGDIIANTKTSEECMARAAEFLDQIYAEIENGGMGDVMN